MNEPNFIRDAKVLANLDEAQYASLLENLQIRQVFLDYDSVYSTVQNALADPEPIQRLIVGLNLMIKKSEDGRTESLKLLENAIRGSKEFSELPTLADRILQLLEVDGLSLQSKAEHLASVGVGVDALEIVCDLRPVFNSKRTEVAGMMPVITLYLDVEGKDSPVILSLSEDMLESLISKAMDASQKISVLEELCQEKKIKVPNVQNTEELTS